VKDRSSRIALLVAAALVALSSPLEVSAAGEPLRVPAERRGFYVGAAVAIGPLRGERVYQKTLAREFNVVVAENAFKFESVHPQPGIYTFDDADAIADFARANGMRLRGHTLVWHNQLPLWARASDYDRDEAIALLRDHVTTLVERYRGRVWAWDVVNEAIADDGSLRTNSFWYQTIGPDYVEMAFRFAHDADPDALLYYNDYGAEGLGRKSDAVYALVADLLARGVPVHGVGWQMHVVNGFRTSAEHRANAARLSALGLELSVTELDVRTSLPATAAALDLQAETYRDVVSFCLSEPAFAALVTWGFTDRHSWIPGFFEGYGAALPFDDEYAKKPAYFAMRERLAAGAGKGPVVAGVEVKGAKLVVTGGGLEDAVVLVEGVEQRTRAVSAKKLVSKTAGATIRAGDVVQARNKDGALSNEFVYHP
jgi:endo-1,4-beta-xylanase